MRCVQWHPGGDYLAVCNGKGVVAVWPYSEGSGFGSPITFTTGLTAVSTFAWAPDGNSMLIADGPSGPALHAVAWTGSAFGSVLTSALASGLGSIPQLLSAGSGIAFNPDSTAVVINSTAAGLKAWPYSSSTGIGTPYADASPVSSCILPGGAAFDPQGTFVVVTRNNSSGSSHKYYVIPFNTVSGFGTVEAGASNTGSSAEVSFHPTGSHVICYNADGASNAVHEFTSTIGSAVSDPAGVKGNYNAQFSPDGAKIAFADGGGGTTNEGFVVYAWDVGQTNPSAREMTLTAVAGGSVYRSNVGLTTMSLVSGGSGVLDSSGRVMSSPAFQNMFFVDGVFANYGYLNYALNTWNDWTTALTAGSLPQGTSDTTIGCNIIALYRGRVVLSGLKEEPHNWFMSASGDPFDWDYSPATTSATQAVAGNNSEAGELGDIITALAPYQDDVMIMGAANSLWVMRGDPAAGGAIDNISRQIGVVGPEAWAFDTGGNFYFFGRNGLYRLDASLGSQPLLISRNKLDRKLTDIDLANNFIRLVYDAVWQGVHIFITPTSQPGSPTTHYFWDERNDAFWPDQYPVTYGPTAVAQFLADNPDENTVMLGGFDGYIRQFSPAATGDDGNAINSYVRFAPQVPGDVFATARLDDIHVVTDKNSGDVAFKLFAGDTVQAAEENADNDTPRVTHTMVPGRNTPLRQRVAQVAFIPQLSQNVSDETWAYESGGGTLRVLNRIHGRRV